MKTIERLSIEEIRYGIDRCKSRLSGVMPMGYMNKEHTEKALRQYQDELKKREQKVLFE